MQYGHLHYDNKWTADRKNPIVSSMLIDRALEKRNFDAAVNDTSSLRSTLLKYFQDKCACSTLAHIACPLFRVT